MKGKIVIFPCNGDCAAGHMTRLAVQELVLEGKAEWLLSFSRVAQCLSENQFQPLIIVDGCESKCLFKDSLKKGLVGKHYLALPELGVEPVYLQDITREDIELVKDAIIAQCTEVDNKPPVLFTGCCCR